MLERVKFHLYTGSYVQVGFKLVLLKLERKKKEVVKKAVNIFLGKHFLFLIILQSFHNDCSQCLLGI